MPPRAKVDTPPPCFKPQLPEAGCWASIVTPVLWPGRPFVWSDSAKVLFPFKVITAKWWLWPTITESTGLMGYSWTWVCLPASLIHRDMGSVFGRMNPWICDTTPMGLFPRTTSSTPTLKRTWPTLYSGMVRNPGPAESPGRSSATGPSTPPANWLP